MLKPLTTPGSHTTPATAGQVLRLRHGLNETVNWRQFAAGPHREQLGARFRELHTHVVRLLVCDKGAPDPASDWEPFAACIRAVLDAGAVPMVTFAKFGPPYDDPAAVRAFAGGCADVVAACVRHWGEAVRDWYWGVWHHPNSDWVSAGMTFDHYRRIYEESAQGILRHLTPLLNGHRPLIGGPAVDGFQPFWSDWIWRFVNEIDNALIGFASWHQFGEWREAGAWGAPADEATFRTLLLARASEYESRARAVSRMLKGRGILNVCGELNAHAHHEPRVSGPYNQSVFGAVYYVSALLGLLRGGADLELWKSGSDAGGPYGLVDSAGVPNPVFHARRLLAEYVRFGDRVCFPEWSAGLGVDVVSVQGENGRRSAVVVHRADVAATYEIAELVGGGAGYQTIRKLDGATGGVIAEGPCCAALAFEGYGVAVLANVPESLKGSKEEERKVP